jgi:hypothetical protein
MCLRVKVGNPGNSTGNVAFELFCSFCRLGETVVWRTVVKISMLTTRELPRCHEWVLMRTETELPNSKILVVRLSKAKSDSISLIKQMRAFERSVVDFYAYDRPGYRKQSLSLDEFLCRDLMLPQFSPPKIEIDPPDNGDWANEKS